ncbi:alpha/beta fold hydrolase [Nonomuraea typhae]|uniref:alpha/beta fold hydrolase n=1 Tax=Nonomuraea typhae TaxID=2603600 RepID=UPI0012F98282|nr:alpha/beta fold hydrolase [Nonomuraea typhae]
MRHSDWGAASPRWAGVRSETVIVRGHTVHYLRAGRGSPAHLLLHPLGGSATLWMDLIPHLAALGQVIVPDLPGTVFGHTDLPHPRAARLAPNIRFVGAFAQELGLEKVTAHGWSAGGMLATMVAAASPELVGRLVLATPALPAVVPEEEARWWRTTGRLVLSAGPPVARALARVAGRAVLEQKVRTYADPATLTGGARLLGGDLTRLSPEMTALLVDELRAARPARLADAATAFASVMRAVFVDPEPARAAIAAVAAPALVLWGGADRVEVDGVRADLAVRRPDWVQHVIPTAGHAFPLETPAEYAAAVAGWSDSV